MFVRTGSSARCCRDALTRKVLRRRLPTQADPADEKSFNVVAIDNEIRKGEPGSYFRVILGAGQL